MNKTAREALVSFKRERKLAERELSLARQAERERKRSAWADALKGVSPLKRQR